MPRLRLEAEKETWASMVFKKQTKRQGVIGIGQASSDLYFLATEIVKVAGSVCWDFSTVIDLSINSM